MAVWLRIDTQSPTGRGVWGAQNNQRNVGMREDSSGKRAALSPCEVTTESPRTAAGSNLNHSKLGTRRKTVVLRLQGEGLRVLPWWTQED